MRRSIATKPAWLELEGTLLGLNLGANFCSEHEWGIKPLQSLLGISNDPKIFGIDRRKVEKVKASDLYYDQTSEYDALLIGRDFKSWVAQYSFKPENYSLTPMKGWFNSPKRTKRGRMSKAEQAEYDRLKETAEEVALACAWDQASFGILATALEDRKKLAVLVAALVDGNAAIWLGGGGVFENAGLCIGIVSELPKTARQTMFDADQNAWELKIAAEETGIEQTLKAADKRWFALSPKWADEIKSTRLGEIKTEHSVIFWLNPYDQQSYESGWFTVEDLTAWARNTGPIIKGTAL